MGLLLGAISACCLGLSDLFAARAGRSVPAGTVTRTALLTAALLSPLLLLLGSSRFSTRDSAIAAASAVLMGTGLVLLYEGYRSSRIGVVGPTSSVLTGVVPVAYDLVRGVHLRAPQLAGVALGIVALALTSYVPPGPDGTDRSVLRGALLGCTSGAMFGFAFVLMARTHKAAGLSTVVVQRWAGFVFLTLLAPVVRGPILATRPPARRYALLTGALGGAGIGALQAGFRHASTALVGVAASQFATVTVLLSVVFNKERLWRWQAVGVGCTAVAVGLMAVG